MWPLQPWMRSSAGLETVCINNTDLSFFDRPEVLRFIFYPRPNLYSKRIPTLIIHGEYDHLIPLSEGKRLYESAAVANKDFLLIPQGDHNDLMLVGKEQYFNKIKEFCRRCA